MNDISENVQPVQVKHSASDALRRLADVLDRMEKADVQVGGFPDIYLFPQKDLTTAAGVVRVLGTCKKDYDDNSFQITKDFGGVKVGFYWGRDVICERIVVGTKHIPERVIPAHDEEVVEWRCPGPMNAIAQAKAEVAAPTPQAIEAEAEDVPF